LEKHSAQNPIRAHPMPTAASARRNNKIAASESSRKPHKLRAIPGQAPLSIKESAISHLSARCLPALLFVSGLSALVFQILWIKQLGLVVGVDVYAVTTGVSAFFGGLALGGFAFGRLADRNPKPLYLYAILECVIAVLAVAATYALSSAPALFVVLENIAGLAAWLLPMVLVAVPAIFMGGTLPVLMRALAPVAGSVGAHGGRLYAANTAGAIAGALLAPFVFVPTFGVHGAAITAAALNILTALAALLLARNTAARELTASNDSPVANSAPGRARTALILYALAGGVALGYEVLWSQLIVQFMSTRSFAFAVVLSTYLLGLVLGSALFGNRADRVRDPWGCFGILLAAAGLVALLEITVLGGWLMQLQSQAAAAMQASTGSLQAAMGARFATAAFCIVFLPTLILGAAFPLALRLIVDAGHVGRDIGAVVALNTVGGIAGTLLCGFVLVPLFGLVHSLAILAVAASAIGLYAVFSNTESAATARWATAALAGVAIFTAFFTPQDRLANLLSTARGGTLAHYEESRGGTVAVVEQKQGQNTFKRLYINGVSNSGDTMTSLRYMRLQALLPLIIQNTEPKSALVIGLGTGITAGALLRYPGLEQRVVAELLPAVLRAVPQFQGNYDVTHDPRMDIRMRDGRRELLASTQRYDLITLEPPPPSAAGVVNLYSTDFYKLAASSLQPGGIVAQWLPLPTQNDADTRSLARSFLDVFPHVTLWTTELHEMMLVGSFEPITLDVPRITQRFNQAEVAQSLKEVGIASPAALLATWVSDRQGLERYIDGAPAVTDDRPRIEYAPWVRRAEIVQTLPKLLAQYTPPPLQGADAAFKAELERDRLRLMRFYAAGLSAYKGDREQWASDIQQVLAVDGNNPYYKWFTGGRAAD
jgi:spermidine synthase